MSVVEIFGAKGRIKETLIPPQFADARFYKGGVDHIVDGAAFANGDSVLSKCWLGKVPSHAVINPASKIYNGAFGAGATLDIGDAKDPDGLASSIDVAAGGNADFLEAISAQNYAAELWQHLGYEKDPERLLDLYASIGGADVSTATAWLTWNLMFSVR